MIEQITESSRGELSRGKLHYGEFQGVYSDDRINHEFKGKKKTNSTLKTRRSAFANFEFLCLRLTRGKQKQKVQKVEPDEEEILNTSKKCFSDLV